MKKNELHHLGMAAHSLRSLWSGSLDAGDRPQQLKAVDQAYNVLAALLDENKLNALIAGLISEVNVATNNRVVKAFEGRSKDLKAMKRRMKERLMDLVPELEIAE